MLSGVMVWMGNWPMKIPVCGVQLRRISQPGENPNGYWIGSVPTPGHDRLQREGVDAWDVFARSTERAKMDIKERVGLFMIFMEVGFDEGNFFY